MNYLGSIIITTTLYCGFWDRLKFLFTNKADIKITAITQNLPGDCKIQEMVLTI